MNGSFDTKFHFLLSIPIWRWDLNVPKCFCICSKLFESDIHNAFPELGPGREIMMGVGNRVASVIMLTFPSAPCPHADFSK